MTRRPPSTTRTDPLLPYTPLFLSPARDQLFATLHPTMRRVRLPSGQTIILSDTVGFISDLPTDLVAAFRATLEEVTEADLILHVRDAAHPDSLAQQADVQAVQIGRASCRERVCQYV